MLDVTAEREEALKAGRDVGFDLERRHPRIERRDHRDRDVEIGKYIDRHPEECDDPKNDRQNCPHDHDVRIAQRKTRHCR